MPANSDAVAKTVNETIFQHLDENSTPEMNKKAADAINDFVRMRMREDGFMRRILPPIPITNDELDRSVDTDKPVKIIDKEPNSPAAASFPFGTLPMGRYIRAPRFRIMFDRILSPRFIKDMDELRTYCIDVRQVLSDNAIKDMLAEEDGKFIATINSLLVGQGQVVPETGVAQWQNIGGGLNRDSLNEALKIMPSTPSHLETATILINNITIKDVQKWGMDEVGGDMSQEILRNGFAEETFLNCRWVVTIKRNLVPDDTIFMFAEPKFLGKLFVLQDTTMSIERKYFMIEFFSWESIGGAIANVAAVARADF